MWEGAQRPASNVEFLVVIGSILVISELVLLILIMNIKPNSPDTIISYKGKEYALYGLVGEGKTHKNQVPVYHPVFVSKERLKDAQ